MMNGLLKKLIIVVFDTYMVWGSTTTLVTYRKKNSIAHSKTFINFGLVYFFSNSWNSNHLNTNSITSLWLLHSAPLIVFFRLLVPLASQLSSKCVKKQGCHVWLLQNQLPFPPQLYLVILDETFPSIPFLKSHR